MSKRIIFVYNQNKGFVNDIKSNFKKTFSPRDYPCSLSKLTLGPFQMKTGWTDFLDTVTFPLSFKYRDEVGANLKGVAEKYPAAFVEDNGTVTLLISNNEFDRCMKLKELIELVKQKIESIT